jgi:hypothetical protein
MTHVSLCTTLPNYEVGNMGFYVRNLKTTINLHSFHSPQMNKITPMVID